MHIADALVAFMGDFSKMDKDLEGVPAKAEPHAKTAGGMFATHIGNGIKLGISGLATSGLAAGLLKLSEPLEKSEATLSAAFDSTGHHIDDYKKKIEEAQAKQATFGHSSSDTNEALAKLTIGFKDPKVALEKLSDTAELAAKNHISLAEAAAVMVKVHAGATKPLKDLGINFKDNAIILADATKATKAHDAAVSGLSKAQDALAQLEARNAGKTKLTVSEQQQLAKAHDAVKLATNNLATATDQKAKAEAAAQGVTKNGEQILHNFLTNYKGAEKQSETFSGRMEGAKTAVGNFGAALGAKAAPALTALGPAAMLTGGLVESGALKMIGSGAKLAASWVADTAKFLVQQGIRLGAWVAANVVMVATAVATGIAAAAAFMLPLLPFVLIGLAVAALVVLVVTHFDQIKAVVTTVVGAVVGFIGGAVDNIVGFFTGLPGRIGAGLGSLADIVGGEFSKVATFAGQVVDNIVSFFLGIPGRLLGVGKDILHTIGQAFAGAAGNIPFIGGALQKLLQSFEVGGIVAGQGPQLIVAHGGERVLTAAQQRVAAGSAGGGGGTSRMEDLLAQANALHAQMLQIWSAAAAGRPLAPGATAAAGRVGA